MDKQNVICFSALSGGGQGERIIRSISHTPMVPEDYVPNSRRLVRSFPGIWQQIEGGLVNKGTFILTKAKGEDKEIKEFPVELFIGQPKGIFFADVAKLPGNQFGSTNCIPDHALRNEAYCIPVSKLLFEVCPVEKRSMKVNSFVQQLCEFGVKQSGLSLEEMKGQVEEIRRGQSIRDRERISRKLSLKCGRGTKLEKYALEG